MNLDVWQKVVAGTESEWDYVEDEIDLESTGIKETVFEHIGNDVYPVYGTLVPNGEIIWWEDEGLKDYYGAKKCKRYKVEIEHKLRLFRKDNNEAA